MLKTIKFANFEYNLIIYKEINNIFTYLLNFNKKSLYNNKHYFINYFINSFIIFYFRIIWRGKAYRVRFFKKYNKFTLNFGHSHWCKIMYIPDYFQFLKIKRQNYVIVYSNQQEKKFIEYFFNNIRVFNKYTKRGMKIKQTPLIRRFGKISQVNSLLSNFGS